MRSTDTGAASSVRRVVSGDTQAQLVKTDDKKTNFMVDVL